MAEFDGQKDWICSGTLISPTVFLTAGHCTAYLESLEISKVWVSFDEVFNASTNTFFRRRVLHSTRLRTRLCATNDLAVVVLNDRC